MTAQEAFDARVCWHCTDQDAPNAHLVQFADTKPNHWECQHCGRIYVIMVGGDLFGVGA